MTLDRDERLYRLDYDWLWSKPPHNDGSVAKLRVILEASSKIDEEVPSAAGLQLSLQNVVREWLESLPYSAPPVWGAGGWAASVVEEEPRRVVVEVWSAGEDVADGIEDAARSLYDAVLQGRAVSAVYEQVPRDAGDR
ncbi:MAG: hypothetical protein Q4E01_01155 [Actinomycetaceae bacterium]|nr:hypothetical protein [Actinomycetaceae bacterium]